jgi:hypothetical protein
VPVASDVADAPEVLERRRFAVPAFGGRTGGAELDPGDPDERRMLIEGEHPEYREALADPGSETVDGVNPRLHITVHEIVANQLWDDDPPEVWQAAKRLSATGMDRHEVLHAIGDVLARHLQAALAGEPADPARYVEQIDRLGRTEEAQVLPLRRKR